MAKVVIYTRAACGYCDRARALLQAKRAAFEEIDAGRDPAKRAEMIARSNGASTYPQIFIGDRHIGGCDDLMALNARGELDRLLEGA